MPYVLGVHLGTSTTSAAVMGRNGGRWTQAAPFPLGATRPAVPSVVARSPDGGYLAGEAAAAKQAESHEWGCSGFVSALGEDAPLLLGGEFVHAHRLAATMIEWVADQVAHRHGHPAEHIAVTHSSAWGPHRTHLLHLALAELGLTDVTLMSEPLAVAVDYVTRQRVPNGGSIAVGNLGGSGSSAAVLRKDEPHESDGTARGPGSGLEFLGTPVDSGEPAGSDLDDLVLERVRTDFGDSLGRLDPTEPRDRGAAIRLRAECSKAKEELSHRESSRVNVLLPASSGEVPLARAHYERLARPYLEWLPEMLVQAVQSASMSPEDLEAVVLAGGPARTPLLRNLVQQRLYETLPGLETIESPVRVDGSPELVAARGAACWAAEALSAATDRAVAGAETSVLMRVGDREDDSPSASPDEYDVDGLEAVIDDVSSDSTAEPPRPPVEVEPMHIEPPPQRKALKVVKLSLAALLIIFGLVMTIVQGFGESQQTAPPGVMQQLDK
ncbi:Hsp70 family protein [Actinopolyspora halophila]|uniref:Hsp70 family protein n=1 Tax=Actinopolyspora halophila TaxID=1850 RepID=UPI0003A8D5D1|nr:Hsp70 family protein [Actinopolyspora halophila]